MHILNPCPFWSTSGTLKKRFTSTTNSAFNVSSVLFSSSLLFVHIVSVFEYTKRIPPKLDRSFHKGKESVANSIFLVYIESSKYDSVTAPISKSSEKVSENYIMICIVRMLMLSIERHFYWYYHCGFGLKMHMTPFLDWTWI